MKSIKILLLMLAYVLCMLSCDEPLDPTKEGKVLLGDKYVDVCTEFTDEQAIELIKYETGINKIEEIKKYKNDKRKEILNQILEIKNLNYSQISRVLGIGKNFKSKI